MLLRVILISFQSMFPNNFCLRRFKEDTDYTLLMLLKAILTRFQGVFVKKISLRLCKENTDYTYESF